MKRNRKFIKRLKEEILEELKTINNLKEKLKEISGNFSFSKRVKGSILHDFYNCCERIFKKIAIEIDGYFPSSKSWHKELLYRMTKPVNKIRPSVISEELAAELDEHLSFSYIFRNIYGFELKGNIIGRLSEKFEIISQKFKEEVEEFMKKLL